MSYHGYEDEAPECCAECSRLRGGDGFWPDTCGIEGREIHVDPDDEVPDWCPLWGDE